jgi:uncharacterized protein YdaU (DUF1376 family)
MTSKVRHVDYSPDEYIAGTGGVLRADEQGIYWMICSLVMSEGGAIVFNERRVANLCLVRPADVKRVVLKLLGMGKLTLTEDGKITQKRAQSEVERASKRIQTATENGSKGGRPARISEQNQQNDKATGFSGAKLTSNEQRATVEDNGISKDIPIRRKPPKRHAYSPEFELFWTQYPTDNLMSKAETWKAWEKTSVEDRTSIMSTLATFRAYCSAHHDYRPVHAVRYITQGRWEGFVSSAKKSAARAFVEKDSPEWKAIRSDRGGVPLMEANHGGKSGWWFDKSEIDQAMSGGSHGIQ